MAFVYRVQFENCDHSEAYKAVKEEGIDWISDYGGMTLSGRGMLIGNLVTEEQIESDEIEYLESMEPVGVIFDEEEVYRRFDGKEIEWEGYVELDPHTEIELLLE